MEFLYQNYQRVVVEGPEDILDELETHNFDFQWIHPMPENAENAESDWRQQHWGVRTYSYSSIYTQRTPQRIEIVLYTDKYPFALYAYMTKRWPAIFVTVIYGEETYYGCAIFKNGIGKNTILYPEGESPGSLCRFSVDHPWFDYDRWKGLREIGEDDTFRIDYYASDVIPKETTASYERLVCNYNKHNNFMYTNDACELCRHMSNIDDDEISLDEFEPF